MVKTTSPKTSFRYHLESGNFAKSAKAVIARIANKRQLVSSIEQRFAVSGFPEYGCYLWLMPMSNGEVAVIEAPKDDDAPFTIISALASQELWRWSRVVSNHYTRKVESLCSDLAIPLPDDPGAYQPATFAFPTDWVNNKGETRTGMQIHCIVSTPITTRFRKIDPACKGGALCSTKITALNRKPASRGCALISRGSHFDGRLFSDGLANSAFGPHVEGTPAENIFNFTDRAFNEAVFQSYDHHSILALLNAFTMIVKNQVMMEDTNG